MFRNRSRLFVVLLAVLSVSCSSAPSPTPEPTASPTPEATPSPTATASPSEPPTPSPSPSPTPSPSPSPSPSPTPSPSPSPSPTPEALAEQVSGALQAALEEQLARRRIPGAAAVVSFPDGTRWSGVAGFASLSEETPVEPDTGFVVGSISKTFVAALILQLAEEDELALDDPLANWLRDYPRARRITLRQLLNHTAGVFNYFEHPLYESLVFGRPGHSWTPAEILAEFEREPYFRPGDGFHYSNTGFILLGLVAERITGNSLGEELHRRFFQPLGLDNTYFQGEGPRAGAAQGYLRTTGGHRQVTGESDYRPTTSAASVAWAAGGVVSTAGDIATWLEALYSGDVLNEDSRAQLMDFRYSPHPRGTYGLGTRTRLVHGARVFGHTGSLRGYMAAAWHFPEQQLTVVVLTNLGRFDGNRLSDSLAGVALPLAGVGVSDASEPAEPQPLEGEPDESYEEP